MSLEALLIQWIFWDDEILGSEADLFFGEGHIIAVSGIARVLRVILILMPF